ncbi:sulfatase domain protein [Cordyceps fumosorosea ARSEF 2679]|uniref:Sulfatase domain protein n=1 Tax=Cordyceps fumosorosea (strain ARSEF 2679) TaxID=1081104 RepID=A0A167WHN7_CORFA|nr:sulfatase domain protein [Cordyceps fumosorosea ARSEF 2679]OAA63803.1 sulfatase domain protein [Cordyceps fumosorosea ARSEF 2679]
MDRLRRLLGTVAARFANRRYVFALAVVSVVAAKAVHIDAHLDALSTSDMFQWAPSFFLQDTILLMMIRAMLFAQGPWAAIIGTTVSAILVLVCLALASINISFFAVAGNELHWRNVALAGDSSSWSTLVTGLFSLGITLVAILGASWLLQDICYIIATIALDMVKFPFVFVYSKVASNRRRPTPIHYTNVPQNDAENALEHRYTDDEMDSSSEPKIAQPPRRRNAFLVISLNICVGIGLIVQIVSYVARPDQTSVAFMSWTLPLVPFMDFAHAAPNLSNLLTYHGQEFHFDNSSALTRPIPFPWLPKGLKLPGFEDWHDHTEHYNAEADPIKIDNLGDALLQPLRGVLKDVPIRNIMVIKLESTRKDVFPIKKGGFIWNKFESSFENATLPEAAQQRLSTLTPNANYLTGDYDDGFDHQEQPRRGGINVNNCHTTGTYTLKSLPGTLCGITPLVADMNQEFRSHVYQPCLAQIFDAFNAIDHASDRKIDDFTSYKWNSLFMQSVTHTFDKQDKLMPVMGYTEGRFVDSEYLRSDEAKFGKTDLEDINYYGMPENAIAEYVKDAFATAKKKNERVFLTHLTSTAHHPFALPKGETTVSLSDDSGLQDLSGYTNAVGFVDRWMGRILDILEETGASNETLIVYVGDHGLSIAENAAVTPYYQPNIGNFHVPLVLSHPAMPPVDVNDVVNSNMILPTILDLLIETGSLGESDTTAARDLVKNYEGQSLIRPLRSHGRSPDAGGWQFTVMNPGRATLSVRDARNPDWRIVVPIVSDIEWRFTSTKEDKHEDEPILDFGYPEFLKKIEDTFGEDASKWAEQATFVSRWWLDDNARRWRYESS